MSAVYYQETIPRDREVQRPLGRGWFIALGVLSLLVGLSAIFFPFVASIAAELLFGGVLIVSGVFQLICAFKASGWKGRFLLGLGGLAGLGAGALMLAFPLTGVLTLTLIMGAFFLSAGILRAIMAFRLRPEDGWGWLLVSSLLSFAIGGLVLWSWPSASTWFLGVLLGVDLLATGGWFLGHAGAGARPLEGRDRMTRRGEMATGGA